MGDQKKPNRRKVQRHIWLPPDVDAGLAKAAKNGYRNITEEATRILSEALEEMGLLPPDDRSEKPKPRKSGKAALALLMGAVGTSVALFPAPVSADNLSTARSGYSVNLKRRRGLDKLEECETLSAVA